ncbi:MULTISPECIES: hypothetical protein [Bacteroidaceae]|uniref:YopX protein domain-containing protein n=1 Tax=Bacteroides mediterraneensis TaxID=1841856 RepID=A0ABS2ET22_9BACE|nr:MULTISPECIES: hypothetical protein [Bacteroidaceae]MBM6757394.1 hypothetical protein [Bacteroides mediterraneensis]MDM8240668.1 hypothetical protein [Phocaeicola barnesiae]
MKRKDIKQEAQNRCDKRFSYLHNSAFFDGFVAGAEWRINSVWHDINETPKDGRIIVLLGKYGTMLLYGPNMMYYKESIIMDGGFIKWAYKEDLMPDMEE